MIENATSLGAVEPVISTDIEIEAEAGVIGTTENKTTDK